MLLNYGGHSWILESELHITTYFLATCTNVPIAGSLRCDRSTVNKVVRANDDLNQLTDFARGVLSDSNSDGILDTVTSPSRTQAWDLDAMGNWQSLSTNGAGQSRTHNAQNQVTGVGSASLTFDANGSMTTDETGNTFVYDAWNRLVEAVDGSSVTQAEYAYDALGRRIVETRPVASTTDHLYHSTGWQVLEERRGGTASGDVRHQYLWSIDYVDAMVARVDYASGTVTAKYNVAYDANWNVTAIFDHNNLGAAIRERYEYDPYGAVTILAPNGTVRSSSSYDWKYLHQTGRLDGDTGLYHFRNRDYSATLGRWTQTDPIGFEAGDTNLYRYVGNGPASFTDALGLQFVPPVYNRQPWPVPNPKNTIVFIGPPKRVNGRPDPTDSNPYKRQLCISVGIPEENIFDYNGRNSLIEAAEKAKRLGLKRPHIVTWGHTRPGGMLIGVDPSTGEYTDLFDFENGADILGQILKSLRAIDYYNLGCNSYSKVGGKEMPDGRRFFDAVQRGAGGDIPIFGTIGFDMPGHKPIGAISGMPPRWYIEPGGGLILVKPGGDVISLPIGLNPE